jgi:hypothetical protein
MEVVKSNAVSEKYHYTNAQSSKGRRLTHHSVLRLQNFWVLGECFDQKSRTVKIVVQFLLRRPWFHLVD